MDRTLKSIALTACLTFSVACVKPPVPPLLDRWVAGTAGDRDPAALTAEIRAQRVVMEQEFISAFRDGPSAARLEAINASEEWVWSLVQVQLAEPAAYGLTPDDLARMKTLSLESEKRSARERFDYRFRSAAVIGLGITQGPDAKALLSRIAADDSSRFQYLAFKFLLAK